MKKLDPKDKMLVYFFPDHMLEYSDGKMPPQVFLFTPKEVNNDQKLEQSITDPKRIVIDLDPGWPYAAGARK